MNVKKIIIAILILAVLTLIAWIILRQFGATVAGNTAGNSAEKLAALPNQGTIRKTPEEMKFIQGKVESIGGNVITISVNPPPNSYETWPLERKVEVGDKTEVIKRTVKVPDVYNAEKAAFAKNPVDAYPTPYEDETIKVSDIKTGDNIDVESATDIKFSAMITSTLVVRIF